MYDILVDVDGTLSDPKHRLHYIKTLPKNWPAFNAGVLRDGVHWDIVFIVKALKAQGCRILITSARNEDSREDTVLWLDKVAEMRFIYEKLYMRKSKDYRNDPIIKEELLAQARADGYDPKIVFDDRNRVVNHWRDLGLRCLQVAPGDF